jgi:hypothetical protein
MLHLSCFLKCTRVIRRFVFTLLPKLGTFNSEVIHELLRKAEHLSWKSYVYYASKSGAFCRKNVKSVLVLKVGKCYRKFCIILLLKVCRLQYQELCCSAT